MAKENMMTSWTNHHTMVNGEMVNLNKKVNTFGQMAVSMMVNGKLAWEKEKVY